MGQKSPSPGPKSEEKSYFNSFLRSQPVPHSLDFDTPPIMTAGLRNSRQAQEQVNNMVKANYASRGRVKSMINAFEKQERSRSNTLPNLLSESSKEEEEEKRNRSAGGTPVRNSPQIHSRIRNSQSETLGNGRGSETPPRQHSDLKLGRPFTGKLEPRKLSTTLEVSMEESISYVKVHPPALENGSVQEAEEEGGGEGRGKTSHIEEVFVSSVTEGAGSRDCLMASDLECSPEKSPPNPAIATSRLSASPTLDYTSDDVDLTGTEGQNNSLSNLYPGEEGEGEGEDEGGMSPQRDKQKKRKKWRQRLFKKRKSTEVDQEVTKPGRSQSDAPSESGGGGARLSGVKMRSISHDTFLAINGRGSAGGRRKVDRYTIYMKDYTDKLEESKKLSLKGGEGEGEREGLTTSQGSGQDTVDRGVTDSGLERLVEATPPAEMTPLTFKQSLFCNQLKYKLRSALQNIHTPLHLSHALQQLQLENGFNFDARYHLLLLIQHSLQRSQWQQDDIETALLTEILRMVEPLPNNL